MAITGGFGVTVDLASGTQRRWVQGPDGVRRWADTGTPVADPVGATHASPLPDDAVITPPKKTEK